MKRLLISLCLLLACQAALRADEELTRMVDEVILGIPGQGAIWIETYRPAFGVPTESYFSPVRIQSSESTVYRTMQSHLCALNRSEYSISYYFALLGDDYRPGMQVFPASGSTVDYFSRGSGSLPAQEVQSRLAKAVRLFEEYAADKQRMDGFGFAAPLSLGALCGLILVLDLFDRENPPEARLAVGVSMAAGLAVSVPVLIGEIQEGGRIRKEMAEIRDSLANIWR
jgi:hypothetical protein